jgi:cell wall-associated NlpC family hydrolase
MKPFASISENTERIRLSAESWMGTPYAPDGAVKGSGCSCSMLPWSILSESGFQLEEPPARGRMLRCELLPTMLGWLMAHEGTHFASVPVDEAALGDVMLLNAGIGHLALCLGDGNVIHCWQTRGVHRTKYTTPSTLRRIVGV